MPTKAERRIIRQWEETLIEDYGDYRSHQILDPLYDQFQQWKKGQMDSEELFEAIHQVHKANRERYNFFCQKREMLVRWIQFDPWFNSWLEAHPAPVGADIVPDDLKTDRWTEMEAEPGPEESHPGQQERKAE